MNGHDVNATLIFILTLGATGALTIWMSPDGLRKAARRLNARSQALTAARAVYKAVHTQVMAETLPRVNDDLQTSANVNDKRQISPVYR
jgi:hypothetical protein